MDNTIYVTNQSTDVSDNDVAAMVAACSKQIAQHVAPAHFVTAAPVLFLPKGAPSPTRQARIISLQNQLDDPQAAGYHTQDGSEHIWGVVGTEVALENGSKVLTGAMSISTILSHEICEMFMDPFCSLWADNGHGLLIAFEIGDPVQSDFYTIGQVAVSDFVTGPWFNPMAARSDKFDYMGRVKTPFTLSRGGYWVQAKEGKTTQKFGAEFPDWVRRMKEHDPTRTTRRMESPAAA